MQTKACNTALEILKSHYGYDQFRFRQAEIVQTLIDGNDALVLMPTGGGKSVCYQIPSMLRDGVGIVISPLIALMQDQVNALNTQGIRASFLNSTLTFGERQKVEQSLQDGNLDLLYVSPERLSTTDFFNLLGSIKIALFAIDEAHCVSQWGHDFRADYLRLKVLHENFPEVPRIALTATADRRTREEIVQQLGLQSANRFVHSFDRP
ncbi:MAG: RecQ family ATP-dependent DNA helicase, partial [Gammaproteobacteria bacterium]|nr:RecQ family ATP-dependent DNA helicase [Gammaproteobacteria bacterium]